MISHHEGNRCDSVINVDNRYNGSTNHGMTNIDSSNNSNDDNDTSRK